MAKEDGTTVDGRGGSRRDAATDWRRAGKFGNLECLDHGTFRFEVSKSRVRSGKRIYG